MDGVSLKRSMMDLTMKQSVYLPTELVCAIIDFAAGLFPEEVYDPSSHKSYTPSETAFKRCFTSFGLVCRCWHTLVQPYLHRTFAMKFPLDSEIGSEISLEIYDFPSILRWLDSHSTLVAGSVHHLRVIMTPLSGWSALILSSGFRPSGLFQILHRFPKIKSIELVDVSFDDQNVEDSEITEPEVSLLNLDRFAIYHTAECTPTAEDTLELLSWVGVVDEVFIQTHHSLDWTLGIRHSDGPMVIPRDLRAHSLVVKSLDLPPPLMRSLHGSQTFTEGTLKMLFIEVDIYTIMNISTLFVPAAPSLVELCFDFSSYCDRATRPFTLILDGRLPMGDFQHLQKLHLKFPLASIYRAGIYWDIFDTIGAQLPLLTSLQSLTITIIDDEDHADLDLETQLSTFCEFVVPPLRDMAAELGNSTSLKSFTVILEDYTGRQIDPTGSHRWYIRDSLEALGRPEIVHV
ncbi:hypothetical protein BDY19DRAFT_974830 [Irpex rosettiformis]|uniref:Uncharacterized protein n=1 Tax=Irpex rosettiformis TaxID=378272 RepID=A0ACB8TPG0_9APHY|nr:hypothetical protein BDY19DRAFT_974830 [Irpex rosettiformis]